MNFWVGFEKRALMQPQMAPNTMPQPQQPQQQQVQKPSLMSRLAVPGAAIAAGLGTYGLLRRGKKMNLTRVLNKPKEEQGLLSKLYHKSIYGADDVKYFTPGESLPAPQKLEGAVFNHEARHKNIYTGDVTYQRGGGAHQINKKHESSLIRRHSPEHHIQSKALSTVHGGKGGLQKLHENTPHDYIIKPTHGFNSGIGGANFVSRSDVDKFLAGGEGLSPEKLKAVKLVMSNPTGHLMQENAGILKGKLSGKNREMRVHVIDGKVVGGATSPRGGNIEDLFNSGKANAEVQKLVDRLPEKFRKPGTGINPDIAFTEKGPKVIELNPGMSSGLTNPEYQLSTKKLRGLGTKRKIEETGKNYIGFLNAVKNNMAIYKHITGRSHILPAALKSTGAAGGVYGAGSYIKNRMQDTQNQPNDTYPVPA